MPAQRIKITAVFFVLLSAIVLGAFIFPLLKIEEKLNEKTARVYRRLTLVKNFSILAKQGKLEYAFSESQDTPFDISRALALIQKWAAEAGVSIETIGVKEPQEAQGDYSYKFTPIELNVLAPEPAILRFIDGLERLKFLCRIVRVAIKNNTREPDNLQGSIRLDKIDIIRAPSPELSDRPGRFLSPKDSAARPTGRNLFKQLVCAQPKNIALMEDGKTGAFIKDLSLVGIIEDNGAKAVIEDKKNSKTYFLNIGDEISDARVAQIRESEVILELSGARYTLSM